MYFHDIPETKSINTNIHINTNAVPKSGCHKTSTVGNAHIANISPISFIPLSLPCFSIDLDMILANIIISTTLHNSAGCMALFMLLRTNQPATPRDVFPTSTSSNSRNTIPAYIMFASFS